MAKTFNLNKTSFILHSSFLNNHQTNQHFKLNSLSSVKYPLELNFTEINCSTLSVNPVLRPLVTSTIQQNITKHAFGVSEPVFFGVPWGGTDRRGDIRAWSKRRPGSKSGGKKSRVIVALECTGCLGNRYTTEKRRVAIDKKEGKTVVSGEGLLLNKYCPKCRKHFPHKEVKLGSSK